MVFNCLWKRLNFRSLLTILLCIVRDSAGGGSVADGVSDIWQVTVNMHQLTCDTWQGGYGMLLQCSTVYNLIFTQVYFVGMISKIELSCLMVVSTKQQSTPLPRQSPNSKLEIPSFVCLSRNWRGFIKLSLLDRVPTRLHSPLLHWSLTTGLGSLFSTFCWY